MSAIRVQTERTGSGFSAWSPDLPGCIATGDTEEEARQRMAAAMTIHLEALRRAGRPVPGSEAPAAAGRDPSPRPSRE